MILERTYRDCMFSKQFSVRCVDVTESFPGFEVELLLSYSKQSVIFFTCNVENEK